MERLVVVVSRLIWLLVSSSNFRRRTDQAEVTGQTGTLAQLAVHKQQRPTILERLALRFLYGNSNRKGIGVCRASRMAEVTGL